MQNLFFILPDQVACAIKKLDLNNLQEVRLRAEKPVAVLYNFKTYFLSHDGLTQNATKSIVTNQNQVENTFFMACQHSVHSFIDQISNGFIMPCGGLRIGICGCAVCENEKTVSFKDISSLNIRLPHEVKDCSKNFCKFLLYPLKNVLIISPPGMGKTTFLRDLIYQTSFLNEKPNVLVADERKRFGFNFPFYNIQLSDYRAEGAQFFPFHDIVRTQQFDALKIIPNSTLTVDMDLGSPIDYEDWAHSPRKLELAERVASLALAREYGIGSESEANSPMPMYARLENDGKAIEIAFEHIHTGLIASGHAPAESIDMEVNGFYVGAYDCRKKARATITTRYTVRVEVPDGVEPTHVGYAMSTNIPPDDITLRNGSNLPCPAFVMKI